MNTNEGENCGNSVQNNHIRDIVCMSIYFFFIIFPPTVEVIALYIFNFTKDQSSIMTMIYLPPIVAVMLSYGKDFLKSFKYFKKRFVIRIGTIILSMLLTLFITSILVMSFELQTPENEKALIESYGNADLLHTVVVIAFLVPLVEEVIFRKILITSLSAALKKKFGKGDEKKESLIRKVTVIFSLGAFIFIHVNKVEDILIYFPTSVTITILYIKSKDNLSYSWSMHMLNNIVAILF